MNHKHILYLHPDNSLPTISLSKKGKQRRRRGYEVEDVEKEEEGEMEGKKGRRWGGKEGRKEGRREEYPLP